jgi:hypothetical protein
MKAGRRSDALFLERVGNEFSLRATRKAALNGHRLVHAYVRFWPKADIGSCIAHVRFWGQSGMQKAPCG